MNSILGKQGIYSLIINDMMKYDHPACKLMQEKWAAVKHDLNFAMTHQHARQTGKIVRKKSKADSLATALWSQIICSMTSSVEFINNIAGDELRVRAIRGSTRDRLWFQNLEDRVLLLLIAGGFGVKRSNIASIYFHANRKEADDACGIYLEQATGELVYYFGEFGSGQKQNGKPSPEHGFRWPPAINSVRAKHEY